MSAAADDYDGLTTAFLGGGARPRPTPRARALPTLLVVGNVPTLAGIWIAQYADQCARTAGAVALIRLDGAATRGEMYRAQGRAMPLDGGAWLERASVFAREWIVCVDSRVAAADLVQSGCAITLMSGTDETAIAAAKRTVESIVNAAASGAGAVQQIDLVFVGSPEVAARSAADGMISWATQRGLSVQLAMTAHAARVDRVESTGPVPLAMLSGLDLAAATELIALAMDGAPSRFSTERVPPAAHHTAAPPAGTDDAPVPAPSDHDPSSLVREYFSQLTPLPFTSPDAPLVHLAFDDNGRLHLIQSGSAPHALRVAAAWARANWKLISMACPHLQANPIQVVEHLLLDDAREAALLHRTGILLHARIDISVAGARVRQRIDLNDAATAGLS